MENSFAAWVLVEPTRALTLLLLLLLLPLLLLLLYLQRCCLLISNVLARPVRVVCQWHLFLCQLR
jgi:hypothetical protein